MTDKECSTVELSFLWVATMQIFTDLFEKNEPRRLGSSLKRHLAQRCSKPLSSSSNVLSRLTKSCSIAKKHIA